MTRIARWLSLAACAVVLAAAPGLAAAQTIEPVRADDRTLGSADAPVTLTVYLSTTCSHCAAWHTQDFPAIKAKYVDTGKVRVVYRDLFTPPVQVAMYGAVMARCVPADKYDAALDGLFHAQPALAEARDQSGVVGWLGRGGAAGGLNSEQMGACVSDTAGVAAARARGDQAISDGVTGTPSFFVNGRAVLQDAPSRDVSAFDAVLQPLLAGR